MDDINNEAHHGISTGVAISIIVLLIIVAIGGYFIGKNRQGTIPQQERTDEIVVDTIDDEIPPVPIPQPSGTNSFFVVSSDSGVNISNPTITANGQQFQSVTAFLAYAQTLPNGTLQVSVSAPGYETMTTDLNIPNNLSITFNLVPITKSHDCTRHPTSSSGYLLCGYVIDENRNALSGVQVSSTIFTSVSTTTGTDGYYEVEFLPQMNHYGCNDKITFLYSKSGYKTKSIIFDGVYIYAGGDLGNKVVLTSGIGSDQDNVTHGMCP